MNEETKKDILEDASIIVTGEAGYSCYPNDIEEYYKEGMDALQLVEAFMNDLRKKGWFNK